jgi:hypothetical protein
MLDTRYSILDTRYESNTPPKADKLQSIRQKEKENKKREKSWEIRVFEGFFEKWSGWR